VGFEGQPHLRRVAEGALHDLSSFRFRKGPWLAPNRAATSSGVAPRTAITVRVGWWATHS
jgi:hypothetical protein